MNHRTELDRSQTLLFPERLGEIMQRWRIGIPFEHLQNLSHLPFCQFHFPARTRFVGQGIKSFLFPAFLPVQNTIRADLHKSGHFANR